MSPRSLASSYAAAASVAGALVGLLFGAITVTQDRPDGSPQRIRAAAALTFFTNALAVSLFSLIEGQASWPPGTVVAISGRLFVLASLIGIVRSWELIGGPPVGIGHEVRRLVTEQPRVEQP